MPPQTSRLVTRLLLVAALLAALRIYLPPYADSFLGDDYVQLDRISGLLSRPWAFYEIFHPFWQEWYYRPWQNVWFLGHRLLFGLNPFGFYYAQITVHLLVVALVYRVGRQLRLRPFAALSGALLFAFHGHHFDTVTWLSSIAIVLVALFSLAAVAVFLDYLVRPEKGWLLALTVGFFLLALLSHEEGFLLAPFLFVLWWSTGAKPDTPAIQPRVKKRPVQQPASAWWSPWLQPPGLRPALVAAFGLMFLAVTAYLAIQFVRPNLNITVSNTDAAHWSRYLGLLPLSEFMVQVVVRYTMLFDAVSFLRRWSYVVTYLLVVGAALALWRGNRVIRLGVFWAALHITFIYWALWTYRPEFFAGRHLYNASLGLSLVWGGLVHWFMTRPGWGSYRRRVTAVALLVALLLLLHTVTTFRMQAIWLAMANRDREARQQMLVLMPAVTADTHVFAYRFASHPSYLPATVKVWYEQPLAEPGGSLEQLKRAGQATRSYYLFDYEDGRLTNLMPELQQYDQTIFLWALAPQVFLVADDGQKQASVSGNWQEMIVAGPPADRRLALSTPLPDERGREWLSLAYTLTLPPGSRLQLAARQPVAASAGGTLLAYRVRLQDSTGAGETLWRQEWPVGTFDGRQAWTDLLLPLEPYWNKPITLYLEIWADGELVGDHGYWGNPSLVLGRIRP
jgi:hypothetical protein